MINQYDELLHTAMNALPKEDGLIVLFKFLHTKFTFDIALCFSVNRQNNIITNFIEYSSNQNVSRSSFKKSSLMEMSEIENFFGEGFSKVFIMNNSAESPSTSHYLQDFPFPTVSSLTLPIYQSKDKNHLICISLHSERKNNFRKPHADLLASLCPLFHDLVMPLYYDNPSANLMLFSSGVSITSLEDLIRNCPDLKEVLIGINDVAKYESTVLIQGETGTGKEIVAETIHSLSPRVEKPFVRVNCGAIPESLLESEFFGYEKGAFTGAIQSRKGFFEQANHGTLYLDEIGELSLSAQTRVLRALENKEITRIGSEKAIKLDIRIIVATNRNLWAMVQEKTFRKDLYYRLNVFPILIPPLRQRKKDIPILLKYYYTYYVNKMKLDLPPRLTENNLYQLLHYAWEGNVRELRHAVERALLSSKSKMRNELDFSFLPNYQLDSVRSNEKVTKDEIVRVLKLTDGRIAGDFGAAKLLNMNPATLRSRLKALGIPFTKKEKQMQSGM